MQQKSIVTIHVTIALFNEPCPLVFSRPKPKPFMQANYLI